MWSVPASHSSYHSSCHTSCLSTQSCPSSRSPQSAALRALTQAPLVTVPSVSSSSVGGWLKDLGSLLGKPLKKCSAKQSQLSVSPHLHKTAKKFKPRIASDSSFLPFFFFISPVNILFKYKALCKHISVRVIFLFYQDSMCL